MPAAMIPLTAAPASFVEGNAASRVRMHSGRFTMRRMTFVAMPSVPSEPTKTPARSYPGVSSVFPPRWTSEPSGRTTSRPSTCVVVNPYLRQCAPPEFSATLADAADRLRGRIGRVEIFLRLNASGDIQVDDAGLDDHASVQKINLEDVIHSREADNNAILNWESAATQARARAARDKGNFSPMTQADNCLDLLSGSGEQDSAGHDAEIRQAVALVSVQLFGRGNQAAFTNNQEKLLKNVGVH